MRKEPESILKKVRGLNKSSLCLEQIEEPQPTAGFRPASYRVSELFTPGSGDPKLPRSSSSSQPQPPEMQAMLDSIHKASEKGAKRMHR